MLWPTILINGVLAILVALLIGRRRQIGFVFSLLFSLFFSFVIGLVISLLSRSLERPSKGNRHGSARSAMAFVFVLVAIFFFFTGNGMGDEMKRMQDRYQYQTFGGMDRYDYRRMEGYENSRLLCFSLALGFLTAAVYSLAQSTEVGERQYPIITESEPE